MDMRPFPEPRVQSHKFAIHRGNNKWSIPTQESKTDGGTMYDKFCLNNLEIN